MRSIPPLLLMLCSLLVACETGVPPTTTSPPTTVTTTTTPPERLSLRHGWEPGATLAYRVELRRRIVLSTEGSPEAPIDDLPSSAELTATAAGVVRYQVAEADAGGYHLAVAGELDRTVEGMVDGEPVEDTARLAPLGDPLSVPEEVRVDPTGLMWREAPSPPLGLIPDPFTIWTGFLGPVLPEGEVTVGEEWSRTVATSPGAATRATGRLVRTDAPDGRETAVVEGESTTPAEEVDLSAFYRDFLASFDQTEADIDPRLALSVGPREERWESRFETGPGRLVEGVASATTTVRVEGAAPDRATGEEAAFEIHLQIDEELESRAVTPSGSESHDPVPSAP